MSPEFQKKVKVPDEDVREYDRRFAEHMKQMREERGLKRDWVATKIDVHYNTLKNWELGKSHPGTKEILALSKVYHCKPGEFFRFQ